jgi:tubulin polyglutamylase TTLL1
LGKCAHGFLPYDFYLSKYNFGNLDEYAIFLDEFQKNPNATWIVKPNNKSQGYGIFLLKKINQLKKIVPGANLNAAFKGLNMKETYVISRYVDNPLLIGGKKFDLRLYCNAFLT